MIRPGAGRQGAPRGDEIRIAGSGGRTIRAAVARPEPAGPERVPGVLVVHELLGLDDDIRAIAARFAEAGYVAVAPDLLGDDAPRLVCMARFLRGVGRVGESRPYRDLEAARAWLAAQPGVEAGRLGVVGFCAGGGFVLLWAPGAPVRVAGAFYPAVPADRSRLAGICPVIAGFGGRDRVFGGGGPALAAALTDLGVDHDVRTYPEAGHSYMNRHGGLVSRLEPLLPTAGGYVEDAAEDSWRRLLAFFDRHLAGDGEPPG